MTSPGEGWALCSFNDNAWVELTGAVYSDETNRVNVGLTIPADTDIRNNEYSIKVTFVKKNEFIKNLDVKKNPYDNNPFGALITFDSDVPAVPTTRLLGKHNNDIVKSFSEGTSHSIDLLGLYNNYNNTVCLDLTYEQIVFRQVLEILVETDIDFSMETSFAHGFLNRPEELYIVSANGMPYHFGFDQHGEIRWINANTDGLWRLFPIGYEGRNVLAGNNLSNPLITLYEMSGKSIRSYAEFNNSIIKFSHEIINIGHNKIAVKHAKAANNNTPYDESMITEIDLVTGAVIRTLDINNIYDPKRSTIVILPPITDNGNDRTHLNSLIWNPEDGTYLVSARNQGVMKFKGRVFDASDLMWWLTPHDSEISAEFKSKLLTPTNFNDNDYFNSWNRGQHSASYLPNGDVMLFNNANKFRDMAGSLDGPSSIMVVRIDETNMTVTKIWEWFHPDRAFTRYMSNAIMLPNGNVLSAWAVQREVFEIAYPSREILFRATPTEQEGVEDFYRVYKMRLYN